MYDLQRLPRGRVGLIVLSPAGIEEQVVYEVSTYKRIYRDVSIPPKAQRLEMLASGIPMAQAKFIASRGVEREAQLRKRSDDQRPTKNTPPAKKVLPPSAASKPVKRKETEKAPERQRVPVRPVRKASAESELERFRADVAKNANVAMMDCDTILRRFRQDVGREETLFLATN